MNLTTEDVQRLLHQAMQKIEAGIYSDLGIAKAEFERVKRREKYVLATLSIELDSGSIAKNRLDMLSYGSKRYEGWLTEMKTAQVAYFKAKAVVDELERKVDVLRSLNKKIEIL